MVQRNRRRRVTVRTEGMAGIRSGSCQRRGKKTEPLKQPRIAPFLRGQNAVKKRLVSDTPSIHPEFDLGTQFSEARIRASCLTPPAAAEEGEVASEDARKNARSVHNGWRTLGSYPVGAAELGKKVWVTTAVDLSSTCLLLPSSSTDAPRARLGVGPGWGRPAWTGSKTRRPPRSHPPSVPPRPPRS